MADGRSSKKKGGANMLVPTIIMGILAGTLMWIGYARGEGQHIVGVKRAAGLTVQIIPLLLFAFIVAGMMQVLVSPEWLREWIGREAGLRGILIGSVAGGLSPGGPFVSLPVVAVLMGSGAGVGTLVAYLTGWSLWAVARLPMEVGILGWKFTAIRFASTLIFPPIAGLIAHVLFGHVQLGLD